MKKRAVFYPFCAEYLPFVKYFNKLQESYEIVHLVSPAGMGLTGKDAAHSRNHCNIGIEVYNDLKTLSSDWDVLFVVEVGESIIYENIHLISEQVLLASKMGKETIYLNRIQNFVVEYSEPYRNIKVPVIFIGGLLTQADTTEVTISFAEYFSSTGLHPVVLTRCHACSLFGFYNYNHIFNNQNLSESEKTMELNRYICALELTWVPDVIIIEAPDAIMRFNDVAPNGFGIKSYMMCQAVTPDYLICCMPYELAVNEMIEGISEAMNYILGTPIDAVHVSNAINDSSNMLQSHSINCVYAPLINVKNHIVNEAPKCKKPLLDVVTHGIEAICEKIK